MKTGRLFAAATLWVMLCSISFGATYGGGTGTAADPYQIWTSVQMNTIGARSSDWSKCFILMANIDMSAYTGTQYRIIGNDTTPFTGVFDGNGRRITHLTITAERDYVGLFGYLGSGGQVKNLGVENVAVTGNLWVGGLVGLNNGSTITSCYSMGSVSGTTCVGGLVGSNSGTLSSCYSMVSVSGTNGVGGLVGGNSGTITSCYFMGGVSGTAMGGTSNSVGGLVGDNSGTITSCYSAGSVNGLDFYVGGLVGSNNGGTITSCYSLATVRGYSYVGGLVGSNNWGSTITSCYSAGNIGNDYRFLGGLVGSNDGTITACFWDLQTTGLSGSASGKGLTTAQMKTLSIFQNTGWFGQGWIINDGVDYPRLSWEGVAGTPIPAAPPIPLAGSGTETDPYLVASAQEFASLSWYSGILDKHIKLTADLDLSDVTLYPIGDLGLFSGVFDGNGHTLSNAAILQPNSNYVSLFSYLGGQIKNLGVKDANIEGRSYVGSLVGFNGGGTITSCYVTGRVSITFYYVGGLVGVNWGTLTSCYSTSGVSGAADSYSVGGLAGYNAGTITSCYSTGLISGTTDSHENFYTVGGLVGDIFGGTITASFWDGQTTQHYDSAGGTGLGTVEMQMANTYLSAGWDFDTVWAICAGTNYPRLKWQIPEGDWVCPDGVNTEDLDYFVGRWLFDNCTSGNNYCGGADVDRSGAVNLTDFAVLAEHWLEGI